MSSPRTRGPFMPNTAASGHGCPRSRRRQVEGHRPDLAHHMHAECMLSPLPPAFRACHHLRATGNLEDWMRNHGSMAAIIVALTAAIVGLAALNGGDAAPSTPKFADNSPNAVPVDTELVIAVDVSYSMDPDEQALQ